MSENENLNISGEDVQDLIKHFSMCCFSSFQPDETCQSIMNRCVLLAKQDYDIDIVQNDGDLCQQYPNQIILFKKEKDSNSKECSTESESKPTETSKQTDNETSFSVEFKEKAKIAKLARCRERFPVPVLFYKNRYVCRSSTLSNTAEIYTRHGLKYLSKESNNVEVKEAEKLKEDIEKFNKEIEKEKIIIEESSFFTRFMNCVNQARKDDIDLLKVLNVKVISDLMVENKKHKYGISLTSSEKVDKENRYSDFLIMSLPYPGCEFFQKLRRNNYMSDNLFYDWTQYFIDAEIKIPDNELTSDIGAKLEINWNDYRSWDLTTLTQNYIHLILNYLTKGNVSVLVHCISGWDRTPLFISLLRLSLWADGMAHKSLSAHQILYFTIAYDWFLFGHNLIDRLAKSEEIFYFCFTFLKYLFSSDYSMFKTDVLEDDPFDVTDSPDLVALSSQISIGSNQSIVSQNSSKDSQDNVPPQIFQIEDEYSNGNLMPSSPNRDCATNGSPQSPLPVPERTRHSSRGSPDMVTNNRTPPPTQSCTTTNRTEPISVPGSRLRSRTVSNSSELSSSFCMVTQTGSVSSSVGQGFATECASNLASTDTLIGENLRRENLSRVREIAISAYNKVIGITPF